METTWIPQASSCHSLRAPPPSTQILALQAPCYCSEQVSSTIYSFINTQIPKDSLRLQLSPWPLIHETGIESHPSMCLEYKSASSQESQLGLPCDWKFWLHLCMFFSILRSEHIRDRDWWAARHFSLFCFPSFSLHVWWVVNENLVNISWVGRFDSGGFNTYCKLTIAHPLQRDANCVVVWWKIPPHREWYY